MSFKLLFLFLRNGELAEWLNAAVLKTVILERVSGVRIPRSPQMNIISICLLIIYTFYLPHLIHKINILSSIKSVLAPIRKLFSGRVTIKSRLYIQA